MSRNASAIESAWRAGDLIRAVPRACDIQSAMKSPSPAGGIVELPGQRCSACRRTLMAHDHDFGDLRAGSPRTRAPPRRRDGRRSVSNGGTSAATLRTTKISPGSVSKIGRRIDAAVRAGDDHHARRLWPSASSCPALALAFPVVLAETAIAVDEPIAEITAWLAAASRSGAGVASGGSNRYLAPHERTAPQLRQAAQARLDPGQGADQPGLSRDAPADARAQPRHGVRGSGLPEHRRVLDQEARDGDDPRRHLHARLRLLQRQDRHAARGRSARAGACRDCRGRAWPRAYRRDVGRPRRSCRTAARRSSSR